MEPKNVSLVEQIDDRPHMAHRPDGREGPLNLNELASLLLAAGQDVEVVPAESWNIKITTLADWQLAQALDPLAAARALGTGPAGPRTRGGA